MRRGQCYRQRGLSRFLELRGETSRLVASIQFLSDKSCQAWVLDLDGNLTVHNGQLVPSHGRDNGFLARIAGWRAVRLSAGNRQLVDHRNCPGGDRCDTGILQKFSSRYFLPTCFGGFWLFSSVQEFRVLVRLHVFLTVFPNLFGFSPRLYLGISLKSG